MGKRSSKISEINMEEILRHNKYFKTVLLAYYMLTRDENVIEAAEKFKNQKLVNEIFEEYKLYISGHDVNITIESNVRAKEVFKTPDVTTIKPSIILSLLKKAPKI